MRKKAFTLLLALVAIATTARAQVILNAENFPDSGFRRALSIKLKIKEGEEITIDKIVETTYLNISINGLSVTNLTGIEHFTALTKLYCDNIRLSSLDVSKNTALTELRCSNNSLTSLDVSKNTALTELRCDYNQLTSLDVSGCTALTELSCCSNQLTSIDVSKNAELTGLYCSNNRLTSLNLSLNTALINVWCDNNRLTSLDVAKSTALKILLCDNNSLTSLNVSGCAVLTRLYCYINQLTTLDVSNNTLLTELRCNNNRLTALNIPRNSTLKILYCHANQLSMFDVSGCTALTTLLCFDNRLNSLDISKNTELKELALSNNQLSSLDVTRNTLMTNLSCSNNQLAVLDVSKNTALTSIICSNNKLASLDVSGRAALTSLECNNNQLTTLDVSGCTALTYLNCYSNKLTSLDLSKNTNLTSLNCYNNQLTSLDVSENFAMKTLKCNSNRLTSLNVSGCITLTSLECNNNQLTSLDVSKNAALKTLKCNSNRLTSLNTAGCSALTELNCDNNPLTSLNVSGCTALTKLNCNYQLTSLNVSGCTALTKLNCNYNQLTSLDVSGCTALTELNCYGNQIKGDAMNALVESLPTVENGIFYVIDTQNESEGNVCTKSQVAIVKTKGWTVYDYNGGIIQEYEGSDNPEQEIDPVDEDTDISQIDNTIYIERVEAATGGQLRLSIKMKNTIEVQGYQFDLYLPEGVSFATDEDGFVLAELSEERTTPKKMNSFDTAIQADGSLRVLCGSSKGYTFDGIDGEVAIITLNIDANMEEGEYPLILKTVKLSDRNSVPYSTDYLKSTLAVFSYTLADVNGDSSIDVADYIAVANYILGNAPDNFVSKAADINEDNSIDVADYIGVANLILSGAGATNAPSFAKMATKAPLQMATDITTLDDAIYVTPITASPGTQQELSIQMKNSSNVVGFEFSLQLPDGITVALDEDNMPMAELSTERTTTKRTTSFDSAIQPNGMLKVLCGTTAKNASTGKLYTFNGNEGEIARITIEIPANYEEGVYEVGIIDALFADEDSKKTTLQTPINSELTIGNNSTVLDENNTEVPEASTGNVNILVKRTIKANEWSTICLPFDMTEEQLFEAFGNDVQLQEFVSYDATYDTNDEVVGIVVNFQNVDLSEGLYGNYPYLIKTTNDISEFSANVTIAPDEENAIAEYDNGRTGKARKVWGSFIGTYHAQTMIPENGLFISGNNFWYSVGSTKMKAFRAYFMFDDVLSSLNAASAKITWMFDGQPTSIDEIESEKIADDAVYTIQGQFVGRGINTKSLPSGIYIMNGQKVVIK